MVKEKAESIFVNVAVEVFPDNAETDEDLLNLGRYIIEVARDKRDKKKEK